MLGPRAPVLAVLAGLALAAAGCGDDDDADTPGTATATAPGTTTAAPPTAGDVTGSLTFTRDDGTTFTLTGGDLSCEPTSTEKKRPAIVLQTADPSQTAPFFRLEAVLADVQADPDVRFPTSFVESDPEGAILFAYDAQTRNELSSSFEDSTGGVRFERASCAPVPEIAVTVDGTIDSEFGDREPARVEGSLRSR